MSCPTQVTTSSIRGHPHLWVRTCRVANAKARLPPSAGYSMTATAVHRHDLAVSWRSRGCHAIAVALVAALRSKKFPLHIEIRSPPERHRTVPGERNVVVRQRHVHQHGAVLHVAREKSPAASKWNP